MSINGCYFKAIIDQTKERLLYFRNKFNISASGLSGNGGYRKKYLVGIDRVERMCGVPIKPLAYRRFLESNPQWVGCIDTIWYRYPECKDYIETQKELSKRSWK